MVWLAHVLHGILLPNFRAALFSIWLNVSPVAHGLYLAGFLGAMFGNTNSNSTPRYTQMQVQTSAQGLPVALLWGTNRLSPNLIWYGNFQSHAVSNGKGGKGGGKGGQSYTYTTAVMMGLCEGPLTDMHTLFPGLYPTAGTYIGDVWRDMAQRTTLAKINLFVEPGTFNQVVWPYLTTSFPLQAISYSSLAYLATQVYNLGYSPSLPSHSFEVFGKYAGSYTASLQSFVPSNASQTEPNGGDVYTSSYYGGQQFTFVESLGIVGENRQFMFSPPQNNTNNSSGTLTLVSGVGPATIAIHNTYTASVPVLDANPADIINDFLTNTQYSIGMPASSIDSVSLAAYKTYCAAQGIFLSPALDRQEQVSQTIDRWASLTNTLIFFSEGKLKFVPLGDGAVTNTSISPNVTYTPNLTVRYDLTYDDFIDTGKQGGSGDPVPPVTITRIDPADAPNHVKIEFLDRGNNYNAEPIEWQDQGLVDQYGQIDSPVSQAHEICDVIVGTVVAQLVGQRLAYQRNTYAFTLGAEFSLLEPGDICTVTDPHLGIVKQPVRIKTIDEDDRLQLAVEAEEFPGSLGTVFVGGGGNTFSMVQPGGGGGNIIDMHADPGLVNPPCVFEPNSGLTNGQAQLWISASGGANYASCAVYASFDGGVTYAVVGYIGQPAPQGVLTSNLASTWSGSPNNPDNTNTLAINTAESGITLPVSASHADAQNLRTLCLLTHAFVVTGMAATLPNTAELLAYGSSVATGTYTDNLTYLYRGGYGLPAAAFSTGDFFTRVELGELQPPVNAVLIYNIPANEIGQTIHLKFCAMNSFGNNANGPGPQDPSTVVDYSYTVTGRGYGSGTSGVPATPSGFTATGLPGAIQLNWNASLTTDNLQYYTPSRATAAGGPYTNLQNVNGTGFLDVNVNPGTTYYYKLTATNAAGISSAAGPVNAVAGAGNAGGRQIVVPSGTSSITLLSSDSWVGIVNQNNGTLTINLPSSPASNQEIEIVDEGPTAAGIVGTIYTAAQNNFVIKAGATTIDTVISAAGGSRLHYDSAAATPAWFQGF